MILLYRILTNAIYPLLYIFLLIRILIKKEDPNRYKEKIFVSHFNVNKSKNLKLLWFHTASIGEFKSIIPLIKEICSQRKDYEILVTTNTLSSSIIAQKELKKFNNIQHRFMPFDVNYLIDNFINKWKPEKIFLVDSEIWPNLILKIKEKKIPLALLNARLTRRSFNKWSMFNKTAKKIFSAFSLCLCANKETEGFLEEFDAKNVKYEGNLKLIDKIDKKQLKSINSEILSNSRFWVAASTHDEEDLLCIKTHVELKKEFKDIITIIIPRHLDRVKKIKDLSLNMNLKTQILNDNEKIKQSKDIIIINSFGVLQKYFCHAKSVFIGKSTIKRLKNDGGQNPIDAAKLGCKIYHGPYVYNFKEIYDFLEKNKISKIVNNYFDLSKYLITDLKDFKKKNDDNFNQIENLEKNLFNKIMKIIEEFLNNEIK